VNDATLQVVPVCHDSHSNEQSDIVPGKAIDALAEYPAAAAARPPLALAAAAATPAAVDAPAISPDATCVPAETAAAEAAAAETPVAAAPA
jgi:hypothetical protein